jgi:hypothetical protein
MAAIKSGIIDFIESGGWGIEIAERNSKKKAERI